MPREAAGTTNIISRVHFRRREHAKFVEYEWYWTEVAPNGKNISVGGEGYDELRGALNGFFASEGMPDWKPTSVQPGKIMMPNNNYAIQKFADDHYVITKFQDETDDTEDTDNGD
jgi:hypothetical protein